MKTRLFRHLFLLFVSIGLIVSCSDDGPDTPPHGDDTAGVLIVCQGNQAAGIAGSLSLYAAAKDSMANGVFAAVNHSALGYGPQNATTCGERAYVCLYDDNCLQIADSKTLQSVGRVAVPQPEWVASDGTDVYTAGNDGYLTRIRPATLDTARLYVGPNLMCVAVKDGTAYVSVSDAWWGSTYENGRRVACVDLSTFRVTREIAVGTNPTTLSLDRAGHLYVACQGNYADIGPEVWQIDLEAGTARKFADGGTYIAATAGQLYTLTASYDANWNATYSVASYNADGTPCTGFALSELPPQPTGIFVSPESGKIFVTSDASASYDGYTLPGLLYVYRPDGTLQSRHTVGVHPAAVLF